MEGASSHLSLHMYTDIERDVRGGQPSSAKWRDTFNSFYLSFLHSIPYNSLSICRHVYTRAGHHRLFKGGDGRLHLLRKWRGHHLISLHMSPYDIERDVRGGQP